MTRDACQQARRAVEHLCGGAGNPNPNPSEAPNPHPNPNPHPERTTSVFPDRDAIHRLVTPHQPRVNISQPRPETVTVQFDAPEGLEEVVQALVRHDYSFEVDQDFEVPPIIRVHGQVNPDL